MQGRTFFRIMFENIFVNNVISKTFTALVNFCNEQQYYNKKELKFLSKMPLTKKEDSLYKTKFIFNNYQKNGVNID